jgi:prephenate dehydrogenase
MATIQVGILGLGRTGTSVGLALRRAQKANPKQPFIIVGYDTDSRAMLAAQKMGAIDSSAGSISEATVNRQIIIMALPYADVREGYRQIGKSLQPGAVILDLSPLILPSIEWADQYLAAETHMVGLRLSINPTYLFYGLDTIDYAHADLFDKGTAFVLPSPVAAKDAVELATDFAELLGAVPRFSDPHEHDGWAAAVEGVPALLGAAALFALMTQDGWADAQRAGNSSFGRLTHHLTDTHPDDIRDLLLNNREAMIRQIDSLTDVLGVLRGALVNNERAALEEALIASRDAYATWLSQRQRADWGDLPTSAAPASTSDIWMTSLFGGFLSKRMKSGST